MKRLVFAAAALSLTACASHTSPLDGQAALSDEQVAVQAQTRNASKIRQMRYDLQSTNERIARQQEAERRDRRWNPDAACTVDGNYTPCDRR